MMKPIENYIMYIIDISNSIVIDFNLFKNNNTFLSDEEKDVIVLLNYSDIANIYNKAIREGIFNLPDSEKVLYDTIVKYIEIKNLF